MLWSDRASCHDPRRLEKSRRTNKGRTTRDIYLDESDCFKRVSIPCIRASVRQVNWLCVGRSSAGRREKPCVPQPLPAATRVQLHAVKDRRLRLRRRVSTDSSPHPSPVCLTIMIHPSIHPTSVPLSHIFATQQAQVAGRKRVFRLGSSNACTQPTWIAKWKKTSYSLVTTPHPCSDRKFIGPRQIWLQTLDTTTTTTPSTCRRDKLKPRTINAGAEKTIR